ncbi:hypothetical protein [Streptomyces sp. NPDC006285]|uniref:hypothetical protein n=1 Tax=Streptomyces sp. NPDC006285 TaxID=3364742 RepID=UPI00367EE4FD
MGHRERDEAPGKSPAPAGAAPCFSLQARVLTGGFVLGGAALERLAALVNELQHQPFVVDKAGRGDAAAPVLEQARGVPEQVVAEFG